MPQTTDAPFPYDDDGLAKLHQAIAAEFEHRLPSLCKELEVTFGKEPAHAALRALLVDSSRMGAPRKALQADFDKLGPLAFIEEHGDSIDTIEMTVHWRQGAEYAGQGIAPGERPGQPASLVDRERRIKNHVALFDTMRSDGSLLSGPWTDPILEGVAARAAIDFGGLVSAEGLQLLSGVTLGAVRNAISKGELHADEAGTIPAEQAKAWLLRRREFCPSRWLNLDDDQYPFDEEKVTQPDENGMILVPQDVDGTPFTPEHVVRTAKSTPGLSITVGAKGFEEQHRELYEALQALLKMNVARWRRRNGAGNWGIVRARGPWMTVSKADIDRQLAAKSVEGP